MEQLSLPYRIALVAIVLLAPLYLLVLKPKDNSSAPPAATPAAVARATPATTTPGTSSGPTAPGLKGLSRAVSKAKDAAATSASSANATDAAAKAATGSAASDGGAAAGTTSTPAAATAAAPPAATSAAAGTPAAATPATPKLAIGGDPSAPILAGLDRGRTEVVLFASRTATDDKAVRRAVKGVDRRGGKVEVRVVSIAKVGDYEAITRGVHVVQAPTVLVIGRDKAAHTIVGFTTVAELNQLVGDVRRSG
ncbi:hypothetical protein NBH00_14280 [Paraconexibacter antarcticus]|uniref:Uncharacterized protein n=1 Tax=Paraconexibacter antarcticus TaxID=2949664 RepID=A0ABY5DPJ3_9ACTN|nr:hypothetical protein [Paraconexibacter antarcticus]UTI62529.1 hypothetical protein NBH00_14280 [Paraconexibacter antarcticus]